MSKDRSTPESQSGTGNPAVEFSWEGGDGADGTPLSGRGWAVLDEGELNGMIFMHLGDDSGFVAKKQSL